MAGPHGYRSLLTPLFSRPRTRAIFPHQMFSICRLPLSSSSSLISSRFLTSIRTAGYRRSTSTPAQPTAISISQCTYRGSQNGLKFKRSMATSNRAGKTEWLVVIPDQEGGGLERRLAIREKHLLGARELHKSGFFTFGGAYLDSPLEHSVRDGATPTFRGSAMVCLAHSKEEVIEVLKRDPYTVNQVWDWDKVQIWAFKTALSNHVELPAPKE